MQLGRRALLRSAAVAVAAACAPSASKASPTPEPPLGPPETTTIRIAGPTGCDPWTWLADDFLKEEGFTEVRSVSGPQILLRGEADIAAAYGNYYAAHIDAGSPVVVLGGTHVGCLELWAKPGISSIRDLRGKTLVVGKKDSLVDIFYGIWISLLSSVGVDPAEVKFIELADPNANEIDSFIAGTTDATLTAVTQGPALRANPKNPGRQIFDTAVDRPWSQYYCCMLVTNRNWLKANPNAAKRATRAVMRAIDYGAKDRQRAVQIAVDKKVPAAQNAPLLYEAIKDLPYQWRDYDPEESLRFFALRLADGKLIKKTPQQIIADGSDFAYFRRLQKELKA
jgi:NitT/TauT family transport system substrate-binding protein